MKKYIITMAVAVVLLQFAQVDAMKGAGRRRDITDLKINLQEVKDRLANIQEHLKKGKKDIKVPIIERGKGIIGYKLASIKEEQEKLQARKARLEKALQDLGEKVPVESIKRERVRRRVAPRRIKQKEWEAGMKAWGAK